MNEGDEPEYIGVKIGLLGASSTLIPVEVARVNDRRQLVEVAADKDVVKDGPTFGDGREITPEFERRVLDYYGVGTAQPSVERGAYGAYYAGAVGDDERVDLRPGERAAEQHAVDQHATTGRAETYERPAERRPGRTTAGTAGSANQERAVDRERSRDLRDEDELRIQRSEEELRVGTREREAGGVNVRKRVRTEREQVRVPKRREEVHVERAPVEGREVPEADIGEDEVYVPVTEEEVVVEKRPVVKEEIRIRKNVVEDEEVVEADVRKEEVDIDNPSTSHDG